MVGIHPNRCDNIEYEVTGGKVICVKNFIHLSHAVFNLNRGEYQQGHVI